MNQTELYKAVAAETGLTNSQAEHAVKALCGITTAALKSGEEVSLPGLGKFSAVEKAARPGRNPQTGQTIEIAARTSPKFTAGKAFKDALN